VKATFPKKIVSIVPNSDLTKVIINTSSEKDPGTGYFYDVSKGKIEFIASYAPWLQDYDLGSTYPFEFTARDGVELMGYLTLPPGYKKGDKIPFILHPHGGPNAKDRFGFNPEVQIYATRGYGVLQINYRGSVGFGLKEMKLANKQWSLAMHDDLLDGLFWANDQGYVNMDKVCISGASYGGYSAMVGITKNPDIFKCAINYVGVVDLYTLYDDKQWMFADMGRPQQHIEMGDPNTERDILENASPINYVNNIKGDLFVIHGRRDRQASYEQVLQLKRALESADIDFEYMIKGDEGHGFYSEANNLELYERMISFLETNLN
jgi:dipeptidyl aminopeptidase/acylaminoacyl peptidase